jgi:LPXTG-motif cell wall-anchored protein
LARTMLVRAASAVGCGGALLLTTAGGAAAQDPPGNNGTVKVDAVEFDDHPDNQPHVGCTFEIDFYGFDEGDLDAEVTFDAVPPTGDVELLTDTVDIGEDAAGGGVDLDASQAYDLTDSLAGIVPHPQQGWHVRLTVHAEGSIGADTKYKEFWVSGCEPTTSTTSTTAPHTTPPTSTPGSSTTTTPIVPNSGTTVPSGSTTTTVAIVPGADAPPPGGDSSTPPGPAGVDPSDGRLPRTGNDSLPLAAVAIGLVAAGTGGLVLARRLRAGDGTA